MDGSSQTVSPRRKRLLTASFLLAIVAFCASSAFGAVPDAADTSLTDFPRLAGETDDAPRLQRAVDASPSGVLSIGPGVYEGCGTVKWRDMMYSGFSSGDSTPGAAAFGE